MTGAGQRAVQGGGKVTTKGITAPGSLKDPRQEGYLSEITDSKFTCPRADS